MSSTRIWKGLSTLILGACLISLPAFAQQKRKSGNELIKRTAVADEDVELRNAMSLDLNCDPYAMPRVAIIRAPKGGDVREEFQERFSKFGRDNPRHICNDKKSKATYAFYKARPGFAGVDRFTFALVYYDGKTDIYDVEMAVIR